YSKSRTTLQIKWFSNLSATHASISVCTDKSDQDRSIKQKLGFMKKYNEDDIDIATYFEETSCCSEDISNIYSNVETVSLRDGDSFKNFEHINLSRPLRDNSGFHVIVITFNDNHNHDLSYKAIQFEKKNSLLKKYGKKLNFWLLSASLAQPWCDYEFGESIGHDNTVFVSNETAETYQWVLQITKKATNNRYLNVFVTDRIQSTSFVESQNAYIKRVLESSNTSLCELEQMKESLYYMASHSIVEEVESLIICESSQSKDMDGELDVVNLSAKCLLDCLERNTIEEIWKLSRVISSKINHFVFLLSNGSYSYTCLLQQKKDLVCWHFYYLLNITEKTQFSLWLIAKHWIPRDQRLGVAKEDIYFGQRFGETTNKEYINEILFYVKVWGLAHTTINKCMLHRNHEFVCLIKEYLSRIHIREDELIGEQETLMHTSFNRHTIEDIPLANPRKITVKGRPKAVSHKNATKITSQDIGNKKKRRQYTCGICKEPGHNVATCPNKVE
ncbi:31755_t:CDS:2, partial [Racocetra persica]